MRRSLPISFNEKNSTAATAMQTIEMSLKSYSTDCMSFLRQFSPDNLLTGAKHQDFSTNHMAAIGKTKCNYNQNNTKPRRP